MHNDVKKASQVLNEGGIIIFPTDTAFGIGCRIDNLQSVEKLYSLRKRPATMAVPVLFDSIQRVKAYTSEITEKVETELMKKYWPGALTIILPANREKVPSLVSGGGLTIGTRIPAHEIPLQLIQMTKCPLIGTSANFHGEPTPYLMSALDPQLFSLVDFVLPGETSQGKESTVIDCSINPWEIKRQGAIDLTL